MLRNKIPILSLTTSFAIAAMCCLIPTPKIGAIVISITGSFVIAFLLIAYIFISIIATWINDTTRYLFAVGVSLLLIEYIASIIFHINLNNFTSVAWNDCGNLFVSGGFIHELYTFKRQSKRRLPNVRRGW